MIEKATLVVLVGFSIVSVGILASKPVEDSSQDQVLVKSSEQETAVTSKVEFASKDKAPEVEVKWQDNPNNCDQEKQYIAKEPPFKCIDKPKDTKTAIASTGTLPVGVHDIGGRGDCAYEISKYDWSTSVALAVAKAESGLRPGIVNHTPATGDYSVGCFQVNIYGANARSRPSQDQLVDAEVNVKWAYNNYVANGRSFLGQWGVCRTKVSCY